MNLTRDILEGLCASRDPLKDASLDAQADAKSAPAPKNS